MAKKNYLVDIDVNGNKIENLPLATNQGDATSKDFVDEMFIDNLNISSFTYNATLIAPPLTSTFRLNNATLASVTQLFINITDLYNFDITTILQNLIVGSEIIITQSNDTTKWVKYKITAATNNTTYYTLDLSYFSISVSGGPTTGQTCKIRFKDAGFIDAPINGNEYVRKNGAWSIATGGGGGTSWNNVEVINSVSDLPTASGGTHTLLANTTYLFNAGTTFTFSNTLTLANNTNIYGFNKTTTILNYTGIGNFINYTNANSTIRDLEIQASTGTVFNVTNTSSFSTYIEQVNFRNCLSIGTINGGGFFIKYGLILTSGTGILLSGTLGSVIIDTTSFRTMTGGANSYAIQIANGTTGTSFRCYNSIFDITTNHYGIRLLGTFTLSAAGILKGNIFSGAGAVANRLSGVNGNTTGWIIRARENEGISGLLEFRSNILINTVVSSSTQPTYSASGGSNIIKAPSDYVPNATVLEVTIEVAVTHSASSNRLVYVNLYNRSDLAFVAGAAFTVTIPTGGNVIIFTTTSPLNLTAGKVYEIVIARDSSSGNPSVTMYNAVFNIKVY